MKTQDLKARSRTVTGSRACRKLRQAGEVPANLYGTKKTDDGLVLENNNLAVSAFEIYAQQARDQPGVPAERNRRDRPLDRGARAGTVVPRGSGDAHGTPEDRRRRAPGPDE